MRNHLGQPWDAEHATGSRWYKSPMSFNVRQMDSKARNWGPSHRAKKAIFSVTCLLGLLFCPNGAGAQQDEVEEAAITDAPESTEATDATTESEGSEGSVTTDAHSGEEQGEETSVEEAGARDEVDDSTVESTPPAEEEAIEPLSEDGTAGPGTREIEPDYFGGLEPSSPAYQLHEPSLPDEPPYAGPFRGGALRFGLGIGGGGYGDQTYLILGFGIGYFLVNGLELHVDTDFWLIGEPFLATPTPGLRYVMWFVPMVHPYVGGFYRHYFSGSGYPDANSVGARGGVYLMTGRSSYFGLGVAYEHMLDDNLFVDTDFIYPEIAFAFSF